MIYDSINMCFESLKKFERLPDLLARKTKKDVSKMHSFMVDASNLKMSILARISK